MTMLTIIGLILIGMSVGMLITLFTLKKAISKAYRTGQEVGFQKGRYNRAVIEGAISELEADGFPAKEGDGL